LKNSRESKKAELEKKLQVQKDMEHEIHNICTQKVNHKRLNMHEALSHKKAHQHQNQLINSKLLN